jgi:hypothetical protein
VSEARNGLPGTQVPLLLLGRSLVLLRDGRLMHLGHPCVLSTSPVSQSSSCQFELVRVLCCACLRLII